MRLFTRDRFKSNPKKKVLIFLGAGATICFGGPRSSDILDLLKTKDKFRTKGNIPVGLYLFNKLTETYGEQTNFETVIASIELILNFYLAQQNDVYDPNLKSIIPVFFNLEGTTIDQIENFTIRNIEEDTESVILVYNENDHETYLTLPKKSAKIYYYHKLLNYFLSIISIAVAEYGEGIDEYNIKFNEFIKYLISNNLNINFFTTNYDNLIPSILDNKNVFNGFNVKTQEDNALLSTQKRSLMIIQ